MNKAEREAKNNVSVSTNNSEEEVGVSKEEMKTKLNKETEEINEMMAKDVADACEPAAPIQQIIKKAEKVIPPPPPPAPKVVPVPVVIAKKVDNRTEIEKAYDRASEAI